MGRTRGLQENQDESLITPGVRVCVLCSVSAWWFMVVVVIVMVIVISGGVVLWLACRRGIECHAGRKISRMLGEN